MRSLPSEDGDRRQRRGGGAERGRDRARRDQRGEHIGQAGDVGKAERHEVGVERDVGGRQAVDHRPRAAGGADRGRRHRRRAADLQHPGAAVVEYPVRQVGEFDADHVAEHGEVHEGGDRRRRGDDDPGDHQRPAGGQPRLADAGRGAGARDEVGEGRDARSARQSARASMLKPSSPATGSAFPASTPIGSAPPSPASASA